MNSVTFKVKGLVLDRFLDHICSQVQCQFQELIGNQSWRCIHNQVWYEVGFKLKKQIMKL